MRWAAFVVYHHSYRTCRWNFAILIYSNEIQKAFPWCSHGSFTLHILPLTVLLLTGVELIFFPPLFPALFSYFIHHLSTPYCLLTASVSFEHCKLLNSQKEVREPHKYTELWPCVRWRRHYIHYYKVILAQSVIQYLQLQCQEQTSNMKNTKELFRNGNSDGWKAVLTPPRPKWPQKTPHFFFSWSWPRYRVRK